MSTILFASTRPRQSRKPFGQGVFVQRDRRLPAGPTATDLAWAAMNLNTTADASDEEWADEFEKRTMSVAEYRAMQADLADAQADRYSHAEQQEYAEVGSSVGFADELLAAIEADDAPARKPRPMTRHQRNRLAGKGGVR